MKCRLMIFLSGLLLLVGCNGSNIDSNVIDENTIVEVSLENKWDLVSYEFDGKGKEDVAVTVIGKYYLEFTASRFGGNDGCNSFGGDYSSDGNGLSFGPVLATQGACNDMINFESYLSETDSSYVIEGNRLTISNDSAELEFVLGSEEKIGLDNKWNLVSYGYQNDVKSSLLPDSVYSLDFAPQLPLPTDGDNLLPLPQLVGEIRCNLFSSAYIADDVSLSIELVAPTEKACLYITLNATDFEPQDSFILNALAITESYLIEGTTLTITSNDSSQLIFELDTEN